MDAKAQFAAYPGSVVARPRFVFMFLPGETFYGTALQHDPSLIEYGVESRVIPTSPVTLMALLPAVSYGWRQEQVEENARSIRKNGAELYKRLRTQPIHGSFKRAVEAYNDTMGSIERSVLPAARRSKHLGAATAEEIGVLEGVEVTTRVVQSEELRKPQADAPRLPAQSA